jgi:hypothetical protein
VTGLFGRVTRYTRGNLANPRENRLTEIFAGVLERVDGLALALAQEWLSFDDAPDGVAAPWSDARAALEDEQLVLRRPVRTQRYTRSGKFVDLELRFARPPFGTDDVVIWVEVKHGASPREHQLDTYVRDLADQGVPAGAVVLLAPRASYPFPEPLPAEVPQRTWQQTARRCARESRGKADVTRFLVGEFLDYLQEEGLMDPDVITPVHLVALAEYERAKTAVALACEVASGYIQVRWNIGDNHGRPYGLDYAENHPAGARDEPRADWGSAFWDWTLRPDDSGLEESRGGIPVFVSGAGIRRVRGALITAEGAAWAAGLRGDPHRFVHLPGAYERFARVAYPEEVLVGRDLREQGENLGRWVVETYQALYHAGPPPGARLGDAP